jgi:hypothetical protein
MSQLAHAEAEVIRFRVPLLAWLAAAAAIAGTAIVLFLVMSGDDQATQPTPAFPETPAGVRYDGGPDEGTRGVVRSGSAPVVRYDGGPEEGGHGITHAGAASTPPPATRYDGGPEEGSRGTSAGSVSSTVVAGVRFDGGPEEGSRGLGR